jgi:tRNA pseudouridine38-40 synthase
MRNVRLTVQYDGTSYHGWQIQANARTIQGELTRVISLLDHRHVTVHGAGRTDAGVHAEGQVASVKLERDFEPGHLRDAINGNLDRDIRVVDIVTTEDSFNARFSARRKTYRYRIWTGGVVSPFVYRYVYHYRSPLDVGRMSEAASELTGRHDFRAFCGGCFEDDDYVRSLERLDIQAEEKMISIVAEADGFLRYMVRTIVGTLIEVGRGARPSGDAKGVLEGKDRSKAGPTAPAAGLTLVRVDY